MNIRRFLISLAVLIPLSFGMFVNQASAHNETNLSLFSCAVTRPDPDGAGPYTGGNLTVNHSHRIASKSSPGHYDWFDCEGYVHPGLDGCIWATYYIYDINPNTGQPYGIFGPFNITCFGF